MNQDKEDYYTFLAATQIEKKEALLFQNVKERINSVLSTDLDAYLAAGKKIRLLD